jgi:Pyruvate/2-oxoacid:ferredoxin oxidoreductase delta subunit
MAPPFPDEEEGHKMLGTIILIIVAALLATVLAFWLLSERWRLLRPSTRKVIREAGLRRFLNLSILHGYIYACWIYPYLNLLINYIFPRLGPRGKKWCSDRYHGKVLTTEHAKAIIAIDQDIPLRDLEQIIPYPIARDLVLKGPPDVAVYECPCRHARANPCQPIQVCMAIGQPFVDFLLEHYPKVSRRLAQSEALELLEAEHERGHLHSAWFKDACLDRFYSICNCCGCCCLGVEAMVKYDTPMVASSGYVVQVDETLCTACATCEDACPFKAIQVNEKSVVNWEACMGCGVCVGQCPNEALSLVRDERKGIPLDVRLLAQEQAV